jgi:hypothetical protein
MPECARVKGQRLFIRAIEASDHDAVSRFLEAEGCDPAIPACGLLGKLVGELVAVVEMHLAGDAIQIDNVIVARELRRKRIGRVMLDEVEQIAMRMERTRMIAAEGIADGFFGRTRFEREGEWWIRQVRSQVQRASR